MLRPDVKPLNKEFSSGPCAKRPNWKITNLNNALIGRSHRAAISKIKIQKLIKLTKEILKIPNDYLVGIVPGSDTGAVEMAMWNALGPKNISILVWESFGKDWQKDLTEQLKITQIKIVSEDYGKLPNLSSIDFDDDVIFNWNGTTSGVCVPDSKWIDADRNGLTICDMTSAAFAMKVDWKKIDFGTFSWQKCLGGEGGHGMIILSPRAVDRINTFIPSWPIPKLLNLRKEKKINLDIFKGSTINTPSMLCVEDFIDSLEWSKSIGGLDELVDRSSRNLEEIRTWVKKTPWIEFLSEKFENTSSTSICLKFSRENLKNPSIKYQEKLESFIISLLDEENVAYDIGSYRSAPPGLRIWGGPTVETKDIKLLLPWLNWAYQKAVKIL